jgi:hypothetical protein
MWMANAGMTKRNKSISQKTPTRMGMHQAAIQRLIGSCKSLIFMVFLTGCRPGSVPRLRADAAARKPGSAFVHKVIHKLLKPPRPQGLQP